MTLEFRICLNCKDGEVRAKVKHLETGITGESEVGENEREMQRMALIDLAHKMGKLLEGRNYKQEKDIDEYE